MLTLIRAFLLSLRLGKEERERRRNKELQDSFWKSQTSFEE